MSDPLDSLNLRSFNALGIGSALEATLERWNLDHFVHRPRLPYFHLTLSLLTAF